MRAGRLLRGGGRPDHNDKAAYVGIAGGPDTDYRRTEAMTETETATITDLVTAARTAYDETHAQHNQDRGRERIVQIMHIGKQLADRGITPTGDPFTNLASGNVCVPIVAGGWDDDTELQIHNVAVEWDNESAELGMPLVADIDLDEDWDPKRLFPAGRLAELADIGRAIANGGHAYVPKPTAADRVRRALTSVTVDYAGPNAEAILAAADAVCEALLDIAEAIRETGAGA